MTSFARYNWKKCSFRLQEFTGEIYVQFNDLPCIIEYRKIDSWSWTERSVADMCQTITAQSGVAISLHGAGEPGHD